MIDPSTLGIDLSVQINSIEQRTVYFLLKDQISTNSHSSLFLLPWSFPLFLFSIYMRAHVHFLTLFPSRGFPGKMQALVSPGGPSLSALPLKPRPRGSGSSVAARASAGLVRLLDVGVEGVGGGEGTGGGRMIVSLVWWVG